MVAVVVVVVGSAVIVLVVEAVGLIAIAFAKFLVHL